jgi:hypothetical protein
VRHALSSFALALVGCGFAACGLTIVGGGTGAATNDSGDGSTTSGEAGGQAGRPDALDSGGTGPVEASTGADAGGEAGPATPPGTGSALSFKAASKQYVQVASIPIPPDFTLEAWIKPSSIGSEMMIVSEDRLALDTDNQFRLALDDKGAPYFAMTDKSSKSYGLIAPAPTIYPVSGPSLPFGRWAHVAVTKSGSQFALYLYGSVVATFTSAQADYSRNQTFDFRIGARMGSGGPDSYFDGLIDDVRFYDIGRTATQIQSDWQSELTGTVAGLVAYWRFDDGSGTSAADAVGTWPGLLINSPTWVPGSAF